MRKKIGNYEAWDIKTSDFPNQGSKKDQLIFLLQYGILAPSSHNSQPWRFSVEDKAIIVHPEDKRHLPIADEDRRLMYFALGCMVENLIVAADYFGFETKITYLFDKDEIVRITFDRTKEVVENKEHLIHAIPKRRTNRNKYDAQTVDESFVEWLNSLSTEDVCLNIILDKEQKKRMVHLKTMARIHVFDNKLFRKELVCYKRHNLTRAYTGIPGFTMGFPTWASFFAGFAIKRVNVAKLAAKGDEELLKDYSPIFSFISVKEDKPSRWLEAGRLFEKIALEAEKRGLQTSARAVPAFIDEFQKELGVGGYPLIFFRAGYTKEIPGHSPRLPIVKTLNN
ncbi:hypothetical protein KJ641_01450 [Patescibacteria group bacterium]|nr:hypothetical protein [Patescibacteria group bacterium]